MELLIKLMTLHYAIGAVLFGIFVTGLLISSVYQGILYLQFKHNSKKKTKK